MLAPLISARQFLLLCQNYVVYLYYCGHVYTRLMVFGFGDHPECQHVLYYPIWAVVDVDYQDHGPSISSDSNIWPIQTFSPNPSRWRSWRKQNGAALEHGCDERSFAFAAVYVFGPNITVFEATGAVPPT